MSKFLKICGLSIALVLVSCSGKHRENEPAEPEMPSISFGNSTLAEEQSATRASSALFEVHDTFMVHGVKIMPDASIQTVMGGYTVRYESGTANSTASNTRGWEYVGVGTNQDIKFWDRSAAEYRFFGVAPATAVTGYSQHDGKCSITVSLNAASPNPQYYSRLWSSTTPASWGTTPVELSFQQLLSSVSFSFLDETGTAITIDAEGNISPATGIYRKMTSISFGPEYPTRLIYTKGTATLTYPESGATEPEYALAPSEGVDELTAPNTLHRVLPALDQGAFKVAITVRTDGSDNDINLVATIPAEYMVWEPNMRYTYILKLTGQTMIFVKVVQVASTSWTEQEGNHEIFNW